MSDFCQMSDFVILFSFFFFDQIVRFLSDVFLVRFFNLIQLEIFHVICYLSTDQSSCFSSISLTSAKKIFRIYLAQEQAWT